MAGVVRYFGYGSNMSLASLRAKGVEPTASVRGALEGWRLAFDVAHWFRHEGGVGNIHPSDDPADRVLGVVHECSEADLERLDLLESRGVGYDRAPVRVRTAEGPVSAIAYVGLPGYLDPSCAPTRRYLDILVAGATAAGLDADYVEALRRHPVHEPVPNSPYTPPPHATAVFDEGALAGDSKLTALAGLVFDMRDAAPRLHCLEALFGGRDTTLFHLRRLDTSDGADTLEDVRAGRVSEAGRRYLNDYLHAYAAEFHCVGRLAADREREERTT